MFRPLSVCALLLACAGVVHAGAAEELAVPQLRGKDTSAASALLKDMGLDVRVIQVAGLPVGVVASQEPAPGAPVARGALVTVRVGTRTRVKTTMPDVIGQSVEDALDALTIAYDVHVQRTPGPAAKAGNVLRTEPPAGTKLWLRGKVMLFVVSGERTTPRTAPTPVQAPPTPAPTPAPTPTPTPTPAPTPTPDEEPAEEPAEDEPAPAPVPAPGTVVQLPDFTGKDLAVARAGLKRLGLTINVVRVLEDDATPNAVVMQVPGGPAEVEAGDTVWLRVAHAAPESSEAPGDNTVPDGPKVKMPTLVGLDVLRASQEIVRRGLLPHPWYVVRAGVADWQVVGQKDAPDTELPRGGIAHFRVALPVDRTGKVSMPYLFGLTASQAATVLRGLALPTQGRMLDAGGRVTLQVPQAGAQIPWGTSVTITVGKVTDPDAAAATELVVMVPPGSPLPPPPPASTRKKKNVLDKVGDFFDDLFG